MWGLLIALVLTAAVVLLATGINSGKKAAPLSWIVAVAGFLLMWLVGARLVGNIASKHSIEASIAEAATMADDALDQTSYADVARQLGVTQLAAGAVSDRLTSFYTTRIYLCIGLLVVLVALTAVGFIAFMQGSGRGGGSSYSSTVRDSYSGDDYLNF